MVCLYVPDSLHYLQIFMVYCSTQGHYRLENGNQSFPITWMFTVEGRQRSQASKVLGTTMDRRCTAWLDQAQWGPGQSQKTAQITGHPAQNKASEGLESWVTWLKVKISKTEYIFVRS